MFLSIREDSAGIIEKIRISDPDDVKIIKKIVARQKKLSSSGFLRPEDRVNLVGTDTFILPIIEE